MLFPPPATQEYNHELSSLSKRDKTKFNANNGFEDNGVVLIERSNLRNEGEGGDYYPEKREHTSGANGGGGQNNGGSANTDVKRISS